MGPQDAAERNLRVLERIELGLIPDEGLAFDEALPSEWLQSEVLDQDPSGLTLKSIKPGRTQLTVTPIGPVETCPPICVRGAIEASAATSCVRCLTDVNVDVRAEVDATLMFEPAPRPTDEAANPAKRGKKSKDLDDWAEDPVPLEQLDEQTYGPDGLDLAIVVRESILLAFEMNPTCEDEASCDARTAGLLDEANKDAVAAENAVDPRWAALEALRNKG